MRYRVRRVSAVEGIELLRVQPPCSTPSLSSKTAQNSRKLLPAERVGREGQQTVKSDRRRLSLPRSFRSHFPVPSSSGGGGGVSPLSSHSLGQKRICSFAVFFFIFFFFFFPDCVCFSILSLFLSLVLAGCSSSSSRVAVGSPPAFPPSFHQMSPLASASCSSPSFAL